MSQTFDYETIRPGYYDEIFHRNNGIQSKWHHLKFACVRSRMGEYRRHLDIGCGPGTFIGTLENERLSIGADVAKAQIAYAQARYTRENHRFVLIEPGSSLPFENNFFDVVTLIEVIEHLTAEENRLVMQEVRRVLRPGGRVLVTTPNYASLWPVMEFVVNRVSPISYQEQHVMHFTRIRLQNFLNECGYFEPSVQAFQFMAPFTALMGWSFADYVQKFEKNWIGSRLGMLLIGQGVKED